jgi:uncharacterized protein (TIGR03000 family)
LRTGLVAALAAPLLAAAVRAQSAGPGGTPGRARQAPAAGGARQSEALPQPAGGPGGKPITFRVLVPTPDARLWVEGALTQRKGPERLLASPPLDPAIRWNYVLKAQWSEEGRVVTDTRRVAAYGGDRITVDFTRPDPDATDEEIVPRDAPAPGGGDPGRARDAANPGAR